MHHLRAISEVALYYERDILAPTSEAVKSFLTVRQASSSYQSPVISSNLYGGALAESGGQAAKTIKKRAKREAIVWLMTAD
jgi:hypothetical protein